MDHMGPNRRRMGPDDGRRPRHHHRGERLWGNPDALKYRFNLSDKQIIRIKAINKKYHNKHSIARDNMDKFRKTLRIIILSDRINTNNLKATLNKIGYVEANIRYYKIMHRYEIEKVLTARQRRMVRDQKRRHNRGRRPRRFN